MLQILLQEIAYLKSDMEHYKEVNAMLKRTIREEKLADIPVSSPAASEVCLSCLARQIKVVSCE